MKAAIKSIVPAALLSTVASIATAESAMEFAVRHFNESAHGASDMIVSPVTPSDIVTVSARGPSPLDTAVRVFNGSADSQSDLIGVNGFTRVDGEPTYGAEIFKRMREESRGQD